MRAEIDRLQDDHDRLDDSALAPQPVASAPAASTASAAPSASSPPTGEVARSSPPSSGPGAAAVGTEWEGSDDYADPEDTTPRPRIRVLGSPRVNGRDFEQVDEGSVSSAEPARGRPLDPEAKTSYDAAMLLVNAKKYDAALDALAAFLVKWPDHPYADHAMYWRGECYFARGDYAHASDQFEGVLARFPAGAKAPDALLKLGMAQQKLGNARRARESFDRLVREFPQSDAARRVPAVAGGSAP